MVGLAATFLPSTSSDSSPSRTCMRFSKLTAALAAPASGLAHSVVRTPLSAFIMPHASHYATHFALCRFSLCHALFIMPPALCHALLTMRFPLCHTPFARGLGGILLPSHGLLEFHLQGFIVLLHAGGQSEVSRVLRVSVFWFSVPCPSGAEELAPARLPLPLSTSPRHPAPGCISRLLDTGVCAGERQRETRRGGGWGQRSRC